MTEMRTAIHNEGEAVYQCVPLGAHLAEVARLEAENKRLRDALQNVVEWGSYNRIYVTYEVGMTLHLNTDSQSRTGGTVHSASRQSQP